MKVQVRNGCFETNSSSTHSFSIGNTYNDLTVSKDGYIHTNLGEFGWEIEDYPESSVKLAYILLVIAYLYKCDFWWISANFNGNYEKLKETEEYQEVENLIKERLNCEGIIIDSDSEGYIDHQSIEDYRTFDEWLNDTGADSIEDFIFGDIILHTDNDNH